MLDDGCEICTNEELGLPDSEIILLRDLHLTSKYTRDEMIDAIDDYLSDCYGFCVIDYSYKVVDDYIEIDDIRWDTED